MKFRINNIGESEILVELIKGDENAFTELYTKYSAMVYAKILRLTKCEETAKEILQELFLKIWEKRNQIDPAKPFSAYLFQIAQNLMYDHFRKVARDKVLSDNLVISAALFHNLPEDNQIYHERLQWLESAIEQLPTMRKEVFKLCKIEGKSYVEIASLLEISPSTISDHIVKANRAIRKHLQVHGDVTVSVFLWFLTEL